MIKKLIAAVVTLVVGVIVFAVCGNGWCFFGEFSKDAAVAKLVRIQNKALRDATRKVELVAEQVRNAQTRFNNTNYLIELTEERKAEADASCTEYQNQLLFFKDHSESNQPVCYTDGTPLNEQQKDQEVERIGMRLEAVREARQAYAEEIAGLRKVRKNYEEWATAGPYRLEALQLKLTNMRQLFDLQNERMKMLNDGEFTNLKQAYKEALVSIKEAKAGLGLSKGDEERKINYDDKVLDDMTEKSKLRLKKIDAWLDNSDSSNESQVSFK